MTNRSKAAERTRRRAAVPATLALLALAGCMAAEGGFGAGPSSRIARSAIDPKLVADPAAFTLEDVTIWNGEQTRAGAWIAHPDAYIARRARITNLENGAQVDAALILRDPAAEGPRVQVSTAAAAALGLDPGHATPILIEAVRYLAADEIVAAEIRSGDQAQESGPTDTTADSGADPETALAESVAEIEISSLADESDQTALEFEDPDSTEQATPPADASTDPDAPAVAEVADEQLQGLPPDQLSAVVGAALERLPAPEAETTGEQIGASDAVSGQDTSSPPSKPAIPPADTENQAEAEVAIPDGRPYIQAGTYSDLLAAEAMAARLSDAGLQVEIRPLTLGADQLSRVLVGPFATVAERDAALETTRNVGVLDAAPARG